MSLQLRDPELCQRCGEDSKVIYTKRHASTSRRRRRECKACRHRWYTYESLINPEGITLKSAAR